MQLIDRTPREVTDTLEVLLVRYAVFAGDRLEPHDHPYHQLTWSPNSPLRMHVAGSQWTLAAEVAIWIPGATPHGGEATRDGELCNLYFRETSRVARWAEPTLVAVTPLVEALIARLLDVELAPEFRARAEQVLFDSIDPLTHAASPLRLPTDPRAREVAEAILTDPADNRTLDDWGRAVHSSRSTLARHFTADTNLSFAAWRTQARVHAALGMLAEGTTVAAVARRVGYHDTSAFIAAFRRATGFTPAGHPLTLRRQPQSSPTR